jgi:hypothetical protein
MRPKQWTPMVLFLVAAMLSAWLSPALSLGWASENALPGGIYGKTILRSGEALDVNLGSIPGAHDIQWMLDGHPVGQAPGLQLQRLRNGEHLLRLAYRDSQGQWFSANTQVRVLEAGPYAVLLSSIQTAISLPLWEEDSEIYLPLVLH